VFKTLYHTLKNSSLIRDYTFFN